MLIGDVHIDLDKLTREQLLALVVDAIARLTTPAPTPTPTADSARLLKVPEVAEMLRCTPGYCYELIKQAALPAVHVGKSVVVRQSAVEEYIHQHERRGGLVDMRIVRTKRSRS